MADLLDIERMRYIEENLSPRYEREYVNDDAASSDHLECLKHLHENERLWDKLVSEKNHPKLKIYPKELDIQAEKEDPAGPFVDTECKIYYAILKKVQKDPAGPEGATECEICFTNRNKVQFKPCNHTLCIGCSNKIITTNDAENKDTTCPLCRANVEENLLLPSAATTSWLAPKAPAP